jgi:hypothetical protein
MRRITVLALALPACGVFTVQAADVVQSMALEDTSCASVVVTRAKDGAFEAQGCGHARRYVCDRDVATAATKPGALSAVGCRRATLAAEPSPDGGS